MCRWRGVSFIIYICFGSRMLLKQSLSLGGGIISGNYNIICPFCFATEETISHLFIACLLVVQVWKNIYKWLDISIHHEFGAIVLNLNNFKSNLKISVKKNLQLVVWLTICWSVWLNRNKILFRGACIGVEEMVGRTKEMS